MDVIQRGETSKEELIRDRPRGKNNNTTFPI